MRFERTTLGQLSIGGKGNYGIAASAVPYSENLLTYLRITDISDQGTLKKDSLMSVADANAEKYLLKPNDIVFARTGNSTGRNYFYDGSDGNFVYAGFLIRFSLDRKKVNPRYIKYYCQSAQYWDWVQSFNTGSTRGNINAQTYANMEVLLPTREQQDFLVRLLSPIDDKIKLNQKINDNLLQQIIALYEHLLDESDWPTAIILDIAEKIAMGPFGSNIKVSTFVPEGVPIISGNHLRGYFLEEHEFNYIAEEHAERLKNSIVFPHDLIFTHAGNIGQVAMIPDGCKYDRYVLSQRQFYLRCDEAKVVPEFLLMFFHSASGQHELLSYANQTGVPSIAQPASNLKKIPFKCPPMQEQLMWQEQVHPLLGRYLNNRLENDRLSTLRDALLPKLMSGELDVSNLNL